MSHDYGQYFKVIVEFLIFISQDTGAGGESNDDEDRNTVENYSSNNDTMIPFVNNTQQLILNDTCDVSTRMLIGENLVAAPNKVKSRFTDF